MSSSGRASGLGNAIQRLERGVVRLVDALALVGVLALVVLTFDVTYGVFMRYALGHPQIWTDELATYLLASIVFFGIAHTMAHGGHIRIDFLLDRLPPRGRTFVEIVVHLIGVGFCVLLTLATWSAVDNFVRRSTYSTGGLDIPLYAPALVLVVGSLLLLVLFVVRTVRLIFVGAVDDPDPIPATFD